MQLSKVTTTSQIARNISVLTKAPSDQLQIITKGSKEIGVYAPIELFRKLIEQTPFGAKVPAALSKKLRTKLAKLDTDAFQKKIRSEY